MPETAIVVAVPEADHLVDDAEGMPAHITLLYPFTDAELLTSELLDRMEAVFSPFDAFDVALTSVQRFHNADETVLWLAPTPAGPLIALIEALAAAFPEHPPYGGVFDTIVPHLTITAESEAEVVGELPIRTRIERVELYERRTEGWQPLTGFRL